MYTLNILPKIIYMMFFNILFPFKIYIYFDSKDVIPPNDVTAD